MKILRGLFLIVLISMLTSCTTSSTTVESSPFDQFENIEGDEAGIKYDQVDRILRSYRVNETVLTKINNYDDSPYCSLIINGFHIGNKKIAVLMIGKSHLWVYIMFSNASNKWTADGFAYQEERDEPEYRVEHSDYGARYWLVVKHEANHGTGVNIDNEIWYNPDGSVAAEYPSEGSTLFLPQMIEPEANTHFSASADYDGESTIYLSYSISFKYNYKDNYQSEFRPLIREYWEFDLQSQQLKFVSCDPALPKGFSTMKHEVSGDYGILQGYIDFYRTRLGDLKITTLEEWQRFIEQSD